MKSTRSSWRGWAVAWLLVVALTMAGCQLQAGKTLFIEGDWSRGLRLGTAHEGEPCGLAVDADGQAIHVLWLEQGEAGMGIHYARLNAEAEVVLSRRMDFALFSPHAVRLLMDPWGELHGFLLAKEHSEANPQVFHVSVSRQGYIVGAPQAVTPPEHYAGSYVVAMHPDGLMALVWHSSHAAGPGVYFRWLDAAGRPAGEAVQVAAGGLDPSVFIDGDGILHLSWVLQTRPEERAIQYAAFPVSQLAPPAPLPPAGAWGGVSVAESAGSAEARFSPPVLAGDEGHIYIFWNVEHRSEHEQRLAASFYVAFPKGAPQLIPPSAVRLPAVGDLPYVQLPPGGPWGYSQLLMLPAEGAQPSSDFIAYPAPLSSPVDELPILFSVMTTHRAQKEIQPGMAVFADGVHRGYQLVARTRYPTRYPSAARDRDGHLYVAWLDAEGEGRYAVYVATTAPTLKAGINRITPKDILPELIEMGWGALLGLPLASVIIVTVLLPLFWIAIFYLFGSDANLRRSGARWGFVIAAGLYYLGKLFILSTWVASPPLLQIVPAPYEPLLRYGPPALIGLLALGVLSLYVRRSRSPHLFWGFIIFVVSDAVLTLLVYGPAFFAP